MGQAISRNVGIRATYNKVLQRAQMEMEQAMKDTVKKDKYGFSDPSAAIGFTRGMDQIVQPTPEEEEVIRQQNEMPPVSFRRFRFGKGYHIMYSSCCIICVCAHKNCHNIIFFIRIWSNSSRMLAHCDAV
jgi:hypothetical protein